MIAFIIIGVLNVLAVSSQTYETVACVSRFGTSVIGLGTTSSIACNAGETIVSCGVKGTQDIGGSYIENGDTCTVISGHVSYNVAPVARCCTFPQGALASISIPESSEGTTGLTASCSADSALTGCQPVRVSGTWGNLRGSYSGNVALGSLTSYGSTDNVCNAAYQESKGGSIKVAATCLAFNSGYQLECVTKQTYTNTNNWGSCDAGYAMFSCGTFSDSVSFTLDAYYVSTADQCYVQQDNHANQWANAICCRLSVPDPQACVDYGTGLSAPHDCSCQAECSDFYCNTMSFVEDRLNVQSSADLSSLCPASETCCCNCPNCT